MKQRKQNKQTEQSGQACRKEQTEKRVQDGQACQENQTEETKQKNDKMTYAKAWRLNLRAWKIWWKLCPGAFTTFLISASVNALSPYVTIWLSAQIINELAGKRDPGELLKWVVLQLTCTAGLALLEDALDRWMNVERMATFRLSDRIYMDKMLSLDYVEIDRQEVVDRYWQAIQNENWAGWGIRQTIYFFRYMVLSVVRIIGGIGLSVSLFLKPVPRGSSLAFLNHPLCAAIMIALLLLIAVLAPLCANRGDSYWNRYASTLTQNNRFFSFFGTMYEERKRAVDLRMYNQQEKVCKVAMVNDNIFGPGSQIANDARGPRGLWMALSQCLSVVLTGIVYLFVCLKAWAGAFGVGSVTQYVGAITQMFLGVSALLEVLGMIRANGSFLMVSFEFMDTPNRMYRGSLTTEKRSDRQYEVEFRDVSFKYPGSDQWALRHVSMKFRVGSRLAVVGMNGSGKTTFIKLLCRLYDPTEGEILLNGIDIRKYRYDDYINIFSVVFQDFKLLALSLGENVAGAASYDRSRAEKCLRDAGIEVGSEKKAESGSAGEMSVSKKSAIIENSGIPSEADMPGELGTLVGSKMPRGLDTSLYKDLDADGVEISGGEAQKIAIARALYKDAPFIILDEPTAALDPIAEAEIYSKFDGIAGDKTAIYISHRLSSCKFCDEIAVFDQGRIIQQGSHEELVADESGKYAELWQAQAQYYV